METLRDHKRRRMINAYDNYQAYLTAWDAEPTQDNRRLLDEWRERWAALRMELDEYDRKLAA